MYASKRVVLYLCLSNCPWAFCLIFGSSLYAQRDSQPTAFPSPVASHCTLGCTHVQYFEVCLKCMLQLMLAKICPLDTSCSALLPSGKSVCRTPIFKTDQVKVQVDNCVSFRLPVLFLFFFLLGINMKVRTRLHSRTVRKTNVLLETD